MFLKPTVTPKITHWGPQKQNHPKIRSKFKVKTEGSIENKSCSATHINSKKVFEHNSPKISPLGP